jgi:integrase/recombinase XerD
MSTPPILPPSPSAAALTQSSEPLWQSAPRLAMQRWLSAHEQLSYAKHSVEQYAAMVGQAADWLGRERGRHLLNADAADLDALLASLRGRAGKPASTATTKRYVAVLGLVLRHLQDLGLRASEPMQALHHPAARQSLQRQVPRFLDQAQADDYIRWVQAQPRQHWADARDAALRLVFLATGITVNEARHLLINDVLPDDVPLAQLRIRAVSPVLARSIALPHWCLDVLRHWCALHSRLELSKALAFPARMRSPTVALHGGQALPLAMSTSEIYDTVRPAMQASGFEQEQLGPQTLRNTYAVQQLQQGIEPEALRVHMGLHTTWSIHTLRREYEARHSSAM